MLLHFAHVILASAASAAGHFMTIMGIGTSASG